MFSSKELKERFLTPRLTPKKRGIPFPSHSSTVPLCFPLLQFKLVPFTKSVIFSYFILGMFRIYSAKNYPRWNSEVKYRRSITISRVGSGLLPIQKFLGLVVCSAVIMTEVTRCFPQ
jgi:hypothetical protein